MTDHRIHQVTSTDGTTITAHVHGSGPPVVLLPAGPGDAERCWRALLPLLTERFTCHLVDTRGRGESADHPDHRPERRTDDVRAVLDHIADGADDHVGLIEWGEVTWSHLADGSSPVAAVVAYEPGADEVMPVEAADRFGAVFDEMGRLLADGRSVDAARAFVHHSGAIYADEDLATGAPADFWIDSAANLEVFLDEQGLAAISEAPGPTDPATLGAVTAPTLIVHGERTRAWFVDSARHLTAHLDRSEIRRLPGVGHWGPLVAAEALAAEAIPFFTEHLATV